MVLWECIILGEREQESKILYNSAKNKGKYFPVDQKHDAHSTLKGGVWKGARVLDAQEHTPH